MPMCPGSLGGPAHPASPEFQTPPVNCRGPGLPDGGLRKTLQGPKRNQKEPSGIHFPELTRNFLTTSERQGNEFIIHNINSACLPVLYFMQVLAAREAHAVSITGDNSSRKTKNDLAEHNGRRTWGKTQSRQYKSSMYSVRKREKKGKTTLLQRDGIKKIPFNCSCFKEKKREGKSNFLYGRKKPGDPVGSKQPLRSASAPRQQGWVLI